MHHETAVARSRRRSLHFATAALGLVLLVATGWYVGGRVPAVDRWAMDVLRVEPGSAAATVAALASDGLRAAGVLAALAAVGLLLWRERRDGLTHATGLLVLFVVLAGSSELLKGVFGRTHPSDVLDVSYPSTHVAMTAAAVVIAAAIAGKAAPFRRPYVVLLGTAVIVAVAATRVLLGEHHVTDVAFTALAYAALAYAGATLTLTRQ